MCSPRWEEDPAYFSMLLSKGSSTNKQKKKGNYFHGSTQELQYVVSYLKMETKETILIIK